MEYYELESGLAAFLLLLKRNDPPNAERGQYQIAVVLRQARWLLAQARQKSPDQSYFPKMNKKRKRESEKINVFHQSREKKGKLTLVAHCEAECRPLEQRGVK